MRYSATLLNVFGVVQLLSLLETHSSTALLLTRIVALVLRDSIPERAGNAITGAGSTTEKGEPSLYFSPTTVALEVPLLASVVYDMRFVLP